MSPNCKVCRDAGKSEQEYSSHWVRDKNGRVTCPTLLSQKCRNCGKSGHTIKYCKSVTVAPKKQTEKKEPKREIQNRYAALEDDEPEQPVIFSTLPQVASPKKTSYLDMLAKEPSVPQIGKIVNLKDLKKSTLNLVPIKIKHSWASEVSSETSEEDNYHCLVAVQM
jgi:protein nanos 1